MGGKWKYTAEIWGLGVWQERTMWCVSQLCWRDTCSPLVCSPRQQSQNSWGIACALGLGKPGAPTAGQLGRTVRHRNVLFWIIVSRRLAKTTKIISSSQEPMPTMPTIHVPQCHIYIFLENIQASWLYHFHTERKHCSLFIAPKKEIESYIL